MVIYMPGAVSKITVTIPKELTHTLDEEVQQMNTTRSQFVREAIEQYLKQKRKQAIDEELRRGYLSMTEDERNFHIQIAEEGTLTANEAFYTTLESEDEEPWW
jgi:CopG family transcriptional regulator/antitoxin EndoAI